MLVNARCTDRNERLPSDTLIADFQNNISTGCEAEAALSIVDVAIGVYLIDKPHWLR